MIDHWLYTNRDRLWRFWWWAIMPARIADSLVAFVTFTYFMPDWYPRQHSALARRGWV